MFRPREFAQSHLRLDDRQRYIEWLDQSGISHQPFVKDTSLIQTHLKRIQLDFESGIAVLCNPEVFEKQVKMRNLDDGRTHLEIEDRLKHIQGKR